jgi:hypothetical protein
MTGSSLHRDGGLGRSHTKIVTAGLLSSCVQETARGTSGLTGTGINFVTCDSIPVVCQMVAHVMFLLKLCLQFSVDLYSSQTVIFSVSPIWVYEEFIRWLWVCGLVQTQVSRTEKYSNVRKRFRAVPFLSFTPCGESSHRMACTTAAARSLGFYCHDYI